MNYGYPMYSTPYAYQQQYRQQYAPQQPQPQQTYEAPMLDVRFATAEEAKAFIVMPNTRALLIDRQGGMAHLKIADNMGQSVTQYFKFEPVNADGTPIRPQEEPTIDLSAFVKREDLQSLPFVTMEQYSALANELRQLKEQIVRGRPNGTKPNNPQ